MKFNFEYVRDYLIPKRVVEEVRLISQEWITRSEDYWREYFLSNPLPGQVEIHLERCPLRISHAKSIDGRESVGEEMGGYYSTLYGDITINLATVWYDQGVKKFSKVERSEFIKVLILHEYTHYVMDQIFRAYGLELNGTMKIFEELAEFSAGAIANHYGVDINPYIRATLYNPGKELVDKAAPTGIRQLPSSWERSKLLLEGNKEGSPKRYVTKLLDMIKDYKQASDS